MLLELDDDVLGDIRGNGEPDPDRAARRRVNCGINADHLPVKIEGRSAGVAAVDRSVDLQEIVVKALVDVTPECGDDPGGHRTAEPERIAHRDYPIPDLGVIAVSPCHVGKLLVGIDLEKGDVGLLVAADHFGRVPAVILKEYRHLVGVGDDMVVGYNVTGGVDDEPGAQRHDFFRGIAELERLFEKTLEELIERRAARPEWRGTLVTCISFALGRRLFLQFDLNIDDGWREC